MSGTIAPKITDGLVFYLDAANTKSYISGDTLCYDLLGDNVGSLLNGIGFDPANNGVITFDVPILGEYIMKPNGFQNQCGSSSQCQSGEMCINKYCTKVKCVNQNCKPYCQNDCNDSCYCPNGYECLHAICCEKDNICGEKCENKVCKPK